MKTKPNLAKRIAQLALVMLISIASSCTPDVAELQDDLDKKNGQTNTAELKTLVKGAPISGTNGLDIGPDGLLYIASVNGQEIVVMNKNNGKILKRYGPDQGVLGPDDLVISPDGKYLYWTDLIAGYVGRMTLDGVRDRYQFVAPGVNPITFSKDGTRLFVGLDFLGDGLFELDPDLQAPPKAIILPEPGGNPFPLGFFNAFDFGEDGRLYGPLFAGNLVISVDVDPDPAIVLPSSDPFGDGIARVEAGLSGEFKNPASAKFDAEGVLTVLDQTGKIFKVDIDAEPFGNSTVFTTLPPGLDNMAFDDDGTLYITSADDGWVAEILPSRQARYISPGGMTAPAGIAVLPGSNNQDALYQADLFRLRQFNGTSGQQENVFKGYLVPEGPESLIIPMNLSADGDNLVVSSWFSPGVQVFNPQEGVDENQRVVESYPNVFVPIDAVRVNGEIVISEFALGGVIRASDNSMIAPLVAASGLATDGETRLWAADWDTGEIWQIDFEGGAPTLSIVASGLENPEGLALDNEGRLLVIENSLAQREDGVARLSRIDLNASPVETTILVDDLKLGGPGLGSPPTWGFDGVTVGSSGDIYISSAGDRVIYKIANNKVR